MIDVSKARNQLNSRCCLVIGDIMLDEYIRGSVEKISPEAPVPIVRIQDTKFKLGGAANVAEGICKLGAKCELISAVGNDMDAEILTSQMRQSNICWNGIVSKSRTTTKKTRIVGNLHQLVRVDKEENTELSKDDEILLLKKIRESIKRSDIIVISDYKKGVCTLSICQKTIELAKEQNKKIIIDPKQSDWTRYKGAFLIKPNLKEFNSATDECEGDIIERAKKLLRNFEITNLLVTRSQDGMLLLSDKCIHNYETEAHEVFDVSGAGDTVIATIATLLAIETSITEAVKISNVAAGISVSKLGTYSVEWDEIVSAMNKSFSKKIMQINEVNSFLTFCKSESKRIVFTNGCFDIIHTGHIALLEQAKQQGDILVVGLNSDASVKRLKGESRPINNELDRAKVLSALEVVDVVVIFDEDTPQKLIETLLPNVLVKGADYTIDKVVGADVVQRNGGDVILVPLVNERSTTRVINKAKKGL